MIVMVILNLLLVGVEVRLCRGVCVPSEPMRKEENASPFDMVRPTTFRQVDMHHPRTALFVGLEHTFYWVFFFESATKIVAFGARLWATDPWNLVDACVMVAMTVDYLLHNAPSGDDDHADDDRALHEEEEEEALLVPLRLFRVSRLVKLIGIVGPLTQMMMAFQSGMRAVAWLLVLIMLLVYAFALMCTTLFRDLEDDSDVSRDFFVSTGTTLDERFGSIGSSMLTLIAVMLNEDPIAIIRPLGRYGGPWCYALLFSFMVITSFGLLNLMIAVMNDAMNQFADPQDALKREHETNWRKRAQWVGQRLFEEIDRDASGTISLDEVMDDRASGVSRRAATC